jgi:chemotaxis protein CheD
LIENVNAVPIGEIVVSKAPEDVLVAYGLGSCVAICLYDPVTRVGGMLHALLPTAPGTNNHRRNPGKLTKFVDQGTPMLVESLLSLGARRTRLVAKLCGGAKVLSAPGFEEGPLNIGARNVLAAESALQTQRLQIKAQDTGGNTGRTVRLHIADGTVTVKNLGREEEVLDGRSQK